MRVVGSAAQPPIWRMHGATKTGGQTPPHRASTLSEARDAQRRRAERAEHDLDSARAELTQLRSKSATTGAPSVPKRRRGAQAPES